MPKDYPPYFKEQAIRNINRYMRENKKCTFTQACRVFNYTPSTIKRWEKDGKGILKYVD